MNPAYVVYPWSAVVGQRDLKHALLLCAIDPSLGGVLVQGPRGVAKTTLARALSEFVSGPFIELPLGASEERVTGTLDLDAALRERRVEFSPGLLARAHQGVLYVDEVNLLPDPLVDLLLDAAASGQNVVERDGVSHAHPSRFVLVGTMNPEEGELRPQLIDRFGLCVHAQHEITPAERAEIVRRRLDFDRAPEAFRTRYEAEQRELVARCQQARARLDRISLAGTALDYVAARCHAAHVEGVRADLAMLRAARAHAAWEQRDAIGEADVDAVAELALVHRRGRKPEPPHGSAAAGGGSGSPPPSSAAGPRGPARSEAEQSRSAHPAAPAPGAHPAAPERQPAAEPHSRDAAPNDTGADGTRAGALPPIPVRAAARPALPASMTGLAARRGQHAAPQRRGLAQLTAAHGRRAHGHAHAARGSIDWFGTLLRRPVQALRREDLLQRARRAPAQQLWILVLDCSSSMLRSGALAVAKGVAHALEARAARAGAHVTLISFRGARAGVEVSTRAGRAALSESIAALGGGGGTPLREALREAARVCEQPAWRSHSLPKRLVLLTDGRCREDVTDLAHARPELELLLIDCERGPVRLGRGRGLAAALGGSYQHVDAFA